MHFVYSIVAWFSWVVFCVHMVFLTNETTQKQMRNLHYTQIVPSYVYPSKCYSTNDYYFYHQNTCTRLCTCIGICICECANKYCAPIVILLIWVTGNPYFLKMVFTSLLFPLPLFLHISFVLLFLCFSLLLKTAV